MIGDGSSLGLPHYWCGKPKPRDQHCLCCRLRIALLAPMVCLSQPRNSSHGSMGTVADLPKGPALHFSLAWVDWGLRPTTNGDHGGCVLTCVASVVYGCSLGVVRLLGGHELMDEPGWGRLNTRHAQRSQRVAQVEVSEDFQGVGRIGIEVKEGTITYLHVTERNSTITGCWNNWVSAEQNKTRPFFLIMFLRASCRTALYLGYKFISSIFFPDLFFFFILNILNFNQWDDGWRCLGFGELAPSSRAQPSGILRILRVDVAG